MSGQSYVEVRPRCCEDYYHHCCSHPSCMMNVVQYRLQLEVPEPRHPCVRLGTCRHGRRSFDKSCRLAWQHSRGRDSQTRTWCRFGTLGGLLGLCSKSLLWSERIRIMGQPNDAFGRGLTSRVSQVQWKKSKRFRSSGMDTTITEYSHVHDIKTMLPSTTEHVHDTRVQRGRSTPDVTTSIHQGYSRMEHQHNVQRPSGIESVVLEDFCRRRKDCSLTRQILNIIHDSNDLTRRRLVSWKGSFVETVNELVVTRRLYVEPRVRDRVQFVYVVLLMLSVKYSNAELAVQMCKTNNSHG
jgi:hypothetical protein